MALTSYFNWDISLQADLNLEASFFHEAAPEEEVLVAPDYYYNYNNHHLLLPYYCNSFDPNTSYIDPYSNLLYRDELVPYDPFMYENHYDSLLPCPKRQKYLSYDQSLTMDLIAPTSSSFLDGNNDIVVPNVPEFYYDEVAALGNAENVVAVAEEGGRKKNETGTTTVSAQSKAARERRRKITEKTQKLGKLVPGGSKMNTADMLHAAAKYVNYLKAQVGMLQLINTLQEDKALTANEEMQKLVTSPVVEEKMYMEEKCFVPKDFVTTLTNHKDIQSTTSILKDLDQFISADTKIKEQ